MLTTYAPIPTTTTAKRPPETQIEYDALALAIRKGKAEELYEVEEFPSDWSGRAFFLAKDRTGERYSAFVATDPREDRCDCIGWEQHGRCKHLDALRHLIAAGRLGGR